MKKFGEWLTERISGLQVNKAECCRLTGVKYMNFYRYLKGETNPSLTVAMKIAKLISEESQTPLENVLLEMYNTVQIQDE